MTETATAATDTPSESGAKGPGQQVDDTLNALLAEFEQQGEQPKPEADDLGDLKPETIKAELEESRRFRKSVESERVATELSDTVRKIKDANDALKTLPDKYVRAALEAEAAEDKRVALAWANRGANPKAWDNIVKALGERMAKEFGARPDPDITDAREAARAAARGTSTPPSDTARKPVAETSRMSDAEFAAYKAERMRASR